MKRRPLNRSASQKIYRQGKDTKSVNYRPRPMRGGIRL